MEILEILEELGDRAYEAFLRGESDVPISDVCFIEMLNKRLFNFYNRRELNLKVEKGGFVHKIHLENIVFVSYSRKPIYETERL